MDNGAVERTPSFFGIMRVPPIFKLIAMASVVLVPAGLVDADTYASSAFDARDPYFAPPPAAAADFGRGERPVYPYGHRVANRSLDRSRPTWSSDWYSTEYRRRDNYRTANADEYGQGQLPDELPPPANSVLVPPSGAGAVGPPSGAGAVGPPPGAGAVGPPPGAPDSGEITRAETLGTEPVDTSLFFLRRQTVLLEPGKWQFDVGVTYGITEDNIPVAITDAGGTVIGVVGGRLRQRLMLAPLEIRWGFCPRVQLFASVPFGWSNTELSYSTVDDFSNVGGIADINTGASVLLREGTGYGADIIGTLGLTFPTGNDSFPLLGFTPNSRLGEGFFATSLDFLFVHTFDPVVVFYGLGYRHRFDDKFMGNNVDPGGQFVYQLGMGFAVNEWITLSGSFLGMSISEDRVNGQVVEGSLMEPLRLRFSATISAPNKIIEPFAEIGMTEDAPSARFGVLCTYGGR